MQRVTADRPPPELGLNGVVSLTANDDVLAGGGMLVCSEIAGVVEDVVVVAVDLILFLPSPLPTIAVGPIAADADRIVDPLEQSRIEDAVDPSVISTLPLSSLTPIPARDVGCSERGESIEAVWFFKRNTK